MLKVFQLYHTELSQSPQVSYCAESVSLQYQFSGSQSWPQEFNSHFLKLLNRPFKGRVSKKINVDSFSSTKGQHFKFFEKIVSVNIFLFPCNLILYYGESVLFMWFIYYFSTKWITCISVKVLNVIFSVVYTLRRFSNFWQEKITQNLITTFHALCMKSFTK